MHDMGRELLAKSRCKSAYTASKVNMQSWALYTMILESGILPQLQFLTFTYEM